MKKIMILLLWLAPLVWAGDVNDLEFVEASPMFEWEDMTIMEYILLDFTVETSAVLDPRTQKTWGKGLGKPIVRITVGGETKKFTAEEFFNKLGFGPTEIVVILDRSGSMETIKSDMVGGLKKFIADQKKVKGKANFSLAQFDTEYEIIYDSVDIQDVNDIDLIPRGRTALLDAIGKTLNRIYMQKAICVIITDGLENSSEIYTKPEVVRLIKSRKKFGWEFIYLGANQDAIQEGGSLGIDFIYCNTFDSTNISGTLNTMSMNVTSFRDPNK